MAQALVNALLLGGVYALMGVGLGLVYGVTKIVNAAHAAFIMVGGYIGYTLSTQLGMDPFLTVPLVMAAQFLIGYALQRILINRLVDERQIVMTIIVTYGIELLLIQAIMLLFGANYRTIPAPYRTSSVEILGVVIPVVKLVLFAASVALTVGLQIFLQKSKTGTAIRACSQNQEASRLVGIRVEHIYGVTFGLGAAMAGASGVFVGLLQPLHPYMSLPILVLSFTVAVFAGFGNIAAILPAGLVLGLVEALGGVYLGVSYQRLVVYAFFLLVLIFRPQGLSGDRFFSH